VSGRDIRYGRRGGVWADHPPGLLLAELRRIRARHLAEGTWPDPVDRTRLFHPETIATARAHDRDWPESKHRCDKPCTAKADPADTDALWAGRARMATARLAAGVPLDDLDHEALRRTRP
jgi:hypothetical protein